VQRKNVIGAFCNRKHYGITRYEHSTTAEVFERWFTEYLLAEIPEGEGFTIIMDNASFHRKTILRKLARGKVRLLFLPPYSPDYNSIEKSWANMKRYLRDNARDFRTLDCAIEHYFWEYNYLS
jgi:transposase